MNEIAHARANLIKEEIEDFEKRYEMPSEDFVDKFGRGEAWGCPRVF